MNHLTRWSGRDLALTCKVGRSAGKRECSKGVVRQSCSVDGEVLLGVFCPGTYDLGKDL